MNRKYNGQVWKNNIRAKDSCNYPPKSIENRLDDPININTKKLEVESLPIKMKLFKFLSKNIFAKTKGDAEDIIMNKFGLEKCMISNSGNWFSVKQIGGCEAEIPELLNGNCSVGELTQQEIRETRIDKKVKFDIKNIERAKKFIQQNQQKMLFMKEKVKSKLIQIQKGRIINMEPTVASKLQKFKEEINKKEQELNSPKFHEYTRTKNRKFWKAIKNGCKDESKVKRRPKCLINKNEMLKMIKKLDRGVRIQLHIKKFKLIHSKRKFNNFSVIAREKSSNNIG